MSAIDDMVKATVRCTKCGAGYGDCDCWVQCACGWLKAKGEECNNPNCTQKRSRVRRTKNCATT